MNNKPNQNYVLFQNIILFRRAHLNFKQLFIYLHLFFYKHSLYDSFNLKINKIVSFFFYKTYKHDDNVLRILQENNIILKKKIYNKIFFQIALFVC